MTPPRPQVGDPAPDTSGLELYDHRGDRVELAEAWRHGSAVLAFLRYFGCPFCQLFVQHLTDARPRFDERNARVVLVGQGSVEQARAFGAARRLPSDVLVDPERQTYAAFGLSSGGLLQLAGPVVGANWLVANLTRGVRQQGLKGGSFSQLPGTFVIGQDGIVRFAHRNRHAADDPSVGDVIAALG